MASLIITESPADQAGKHFVIKKRALAGGRDPSQEIQLLDQEVSRKHFVIRFEADGHTIVETHATNGTFVNGEKVTQKKLQNGDEIKVGKTVLIYYTDDQARTDAVQQQRRADRRLREDRTLREDLPPGPLKNSP